VALTLLILPFAALVGILVAVAVLLDSPGPVLYRSRRVGRDGEPFEMLKFRTMRHPADGPRISRWRDERQTPLGRFLAATRLDELPQVWNVLKGEMALVGPRPEVEEFVAAQAEAYERILTVPPGLTGPTQLEYADEGRVLARAPDAVRAYLDEVLPLKVYLDLQYVESNNLRGDLTALARTLLLPARKAAERAQVTFTDRAQSRWEQLQVLVAGVGALVLTVVFASNGASGL
jgi:lipopolysaccharide/colanic/teichoic acid biosynthesis glycosyltransferase